MAELKRNKISKNVIRRLPRYLRKLDELAAEGVERVSSGALGTLTGLTPSQIRQDFSCFGEFGQQGYGYNVASLREAIAHILGMDRGYTAILVGTGRIGQSLLENFNCARLGLRLLGAFDVRKDLIGTRIHDVTVSDASELETFIRANAVDIAILSTSRASAQRVAERLAAAGIRSIWNFTEREIDVGDSGVVIESIHFSDSLLTLTYYLTESGGLL